MRTSVHKVPDPEEAVTARDEIELGKGALERTEAAMDVTDHKVPTGLVGADDASTRGCHRLSPAGRGSNNVRRPVLHDLAPETEKIGPANSCDRITTDVAKARLRDLRRNTGFRAPLTEACPKRAGSEPNVKRDQKP